MGTIKIEKSFELKPYTKKDLRLIMDIPCSTFRRWLQNIPNAKIPKYKNWLSTNQVKLIVETYGTLKMMNDCKENSNSIPINKCQ